MPRSSRSRSVRRPRSPSASTSPARGDDLSPRPLAIGLLLLGAFVLAAAPSTAQEPIFATVSGPPAVAAGLPAAFNVSIVGGPAGPANYTVKYYITGSDLTGGLPLQSNPTTATGTNRTVRVNVTAPMKDQTITLVVQVSAGAGGAVENTSAEQTIVVVTPIVLSATFHNGGSTAAVNVTVRFLVDDVAIGTKTLPKIGANQDATATFNYLPAGLTPGTHTVRIEADLDGNGVIDPARGESVVSQLFYKGTPPLSTGWTVLIGIGVFIPAFLVTVAMRRRGRP